MRWRIDMKRVIEYLKSLLLLELAAGLWVTLKYLFKPKYTVLFPDNAKRRYVRGSLRMIHESGTQKAKAAQLELFGAGNAAR